MSSLPSRVQWLSLYRGLLRAGHRFRDYNFREYVLRSTRDKFRTYGAQFRQQKLESQDLQALYLNGMQELKVAQRQSTISQMYDTGSFVMEKKKPFRSSASQHTQTPSTNFPSAT